MKRALLALVVGAALVALHPAAAATEIDATYAAEGPAAVTTATRTDGSAVTHRLFSPADLGPPGTRHPVVTWGNGSFETPAKYEALLTHLASWGFIVVAAETTSAGTGGEMLEGARGLVAADADPGSRFFGHVDTAHIAAVGHSQGAGGAMRAAADPSGLITTVVPVALPNRLFALLGTDHDFDSAAVSVPAFFMSGIDDTFISSASTVRDFYDRAGGPAAMGILDGADHNTIQHDGGAFVGYLTAWLRYQLAGDATAAAAFTGASPELLTNPGWRQTSVRDLVAPEAVTTTTTSTTPGPTTRSSTTGPSTSAAAPPRGALPATGGVPPFLPVAALTFAVADAVRRACRT